MLHKSKHLAIALILITNSYAAVSLSVDYTDATQNKRTLNYPWNVSNRISPIDGFAIPVDSDAGLNVIRPLGGKSKNGVKLLDEDTYLWDDVNKKYYYNWEPLKKQIDNIHNKNFEVFQLVLDNPSWAFQRGIDLGSFPEIDSYGNSIWPNSNVEWSNYIKAMLNEMIKTYGEEIVAKWRFRIGSEIGTPGHWRGTNQQFFTHYKNTEKAIHSVIPSAKVGTHFLWASANHSMGPEFVKWAKSNGAKYDFIGISYYPFFHKEDRVNIDNVYNVDIAPIVNIPEWNQEASFEIHEYVLIKSINGGSYESIGSRHRSAFTIMLSKLLYEKNIPKVFTWGAGKDNNIKTTAEQDAILSPDQLAENALISLEGKDYFSNKKSGNPNIAGNMINGIFTKEKTKNNYEIFLYNYNPTPSSIGNEPVNFKLTAPVKENTDFKYRYAIIDKKNVAFDKYQIDFPKAAKFEKEGGWIKDDFNLYGGSSSLNDEGLEHYKTNINAYTKYNNLQWSNWSSDKTKLGTKTGTSLIDLNASLAEFSFIKYEIEVSEPVVEAKGPYNAKAISIPGTIKAAEFDKGGEGISYHDNDAVNAGGAFRLNDGVDITGDTTNGFVVGYSAVGEWLNYSVNVKTAGKYTFSFETAAATLEGQIKVESGTKILFDKVTLPITGDWAKFENTKTQSVALATGEQIIKISTLARGFNFKSFSVALEEEPITSAIQNLAQQATGEITIYDIRGDLIRRAKSDQLDLSSLSKGFYFAVIKTSDSQITKRFYISK